MYTWYYITDRVHSYVATPCTYLTRILDIKLVGISRALRIVVVHKVISYAYLGNSDHNCNCECNYKDKGLSQCVQK